MRGLLWVRSEHGCDPHEFLRHQDLTAAAPFALEFCPFGLRHWDIEFCPFIAHKAVARPFVESIGNPVTRTELPSGAAMD